MKADINCCTLLGHKFLHSTTRKAKKGKIKEFEEWMDGIIHEAIKFEGHMGVNIISPSDALSNPEYVIIFRFNTYENLMRWEKSDIRKEWLEKSKNVTGRTSVQKYIARETHCESPLFLQDYRLVRFRLHKNSLNYLDLPTHYIHLGLSKSIC